MTASQAFSQKLYEAAARDAERGRHVGRGRHRRRRPNDDEVVDAEIVDEDEADVPTGRRRDRHRRSRRRRRRSRSRRRRIDEPTRPTPRAERRALADESRPRADVELDSSCPLAERDEYTRHRPARLQADFENYRKRMADAARPTTSTGRPGRLVEELLPVLDACERGRSPTAAEDVEPIWSALLGDAAEAGPGARSTSTGPAVRPAPCTKPSLHEPGDGGEPDGRRGAAHRLPLEGHGPAAGHGEGAGLTSAAAGRMAPQREWFEKDYYKVLGVADDGQRQGDHQGLPQAGARAPPRRQPGDAAAEERFKEISAAYDVLGDEAKRKEYDEVRRLGPMGGTPVASAPAAPAGSPARRLHLQRRRRRPRRPARQPVRPGPAGRRGQRPAAGPQRGADLEAELHLRFADAVQGHHHHPLPDQRCGLLDGITTWRRPRSSPRSAGIWPPGRMP